jgi:hypothetical protein
METLFRVQDNGKLDLQCINTASLFVPVMPLFEKLQEDAPRNEHHFVSSICLL